jgi:SPP1 family predicted phage head-tail adaptor
MPFLPDRIAILKRSTTADGQGGRTTTWVDLVTGTATRTRLSAEVTPLTVGERIQAAAIGSAVTYRVEQRYRADVTAKMRVEWTPFKATTAKTFEIHGVTPKDGRRQYLLLECSEVV